MADTKHLRLHRRRWYLNLRLPQEIAHKLGRTHLYTSLKTGDLAEAQRRRNELLGELEREFRELRGQPDWQTPAGIVATARALRAGIATGTETPDGALDALSEFESWNCTQPDPERYALRVPAEMVPAFEQAREIVRGDDSDGLTLSSALDRHCEALAKTARASTVTARRRRVTALCDTLGDPPLATISRQVLARHTLALTGAPKTKRDTCSDLTAFFRWCVDAGLIDSSPAERLSRLVRESSRGVENDGQRRPWTDAEVAELLRRIETLKTGDYLRKLVPTALFSGMRLNEI